VIGVLQEVNQRASSNPALPPDDFIRVLRELLETVQIKQPDSHRGAIDDLNSVLARDGIQIRFTSGRYIFTTTTELAELEKLEHRVERSEGPSEQATGLAVITGDANVVGDHNVATVNKQSAGDYAIQIGQLHLTLSPDQLRSLPVSAPTASPLPAAPTRLPWEPEMIPIPAGEFWMGTDRQAVELAGIQWDDGWFECETPYHRVYLPNYAIGKYPVTNAEFARFIEDGGYWNAQLWTRSGWEWKEKEAWTHSRLWGKPGYNDPSQPVVGVSWYEAAAYCNWLAAKTGKPYRLPSEAEWEKAARGTDGRLWPWGNRWDPHRCNSREIGPGRPTPVGQYSPNGDSLYGVADMAGNVSEWTRSLWGKGLESVFRYPYKPEDGRENLEAGPDDFRLLRGGCFGDGDGFVRCAHREGDIPIGWSASYGFRLVASPVRL